MKTRTEAVAFLRNAGFDAAKRDWAMGETIVVPAEPDAEPNTGIVVYRRVIYLVPNPQAGRSTK